MRALSAFFILSLFFLFLNVISIRKSNTPVNSPSSFACGQFSSFCDARKDPTDYWNSIMKGEPMPESIQQLVLHLDPSSPSKEKIKKWHSSSGSVNMDHFRKDFNTRPNAIIYHSHGEPKN
ncbi:hypothetical protein RHSIM_Rhsim11G0174800 [Rhododendron simsii]|uniref:Uncharacterized protein n=1 Tax=Rhododendron simsii TaxID=118357 RepID=A0A834G6M4_RHOSS|nr:hypothetical protein RHSIM_Rhsim11G0174800 [Rhododendron simsii]